VEINLSIVKKDGSREPFNREKLKEGLLKACEKRPIKLEKIEQTVNQIEAELLKKDISEVKSTTVGKLVMRKLKKLDKVAYIRFASVYREFTDLDSFKKEMDKLIQKKANGN